jgi:hypothetical protein
MHEERCKVDETQGRESETWKMGTSLAETDVEGKERVVEEGLKYGKRDATAYETVSPGVRGGGGAVGTDDEEGREDGHVP